MTMNNQQRKALLSIVFWGTPLILATVHMEFALDFTEYLNTIAILTTMSSIAGFAFVYDKKDQVSHRAFEIFLTFSIPYIVPSMVMGEALTLLGVAKLTLPFIIGFWITVFGIFIWCFYDYKRTGCVDRGEEILLRLTGAGKL